MIKPITLSNDTKKQTITIDKFAGINVGTKLDENESPDMLNCFVNENDALEKRTGYEKSIPKVLGNQRINGIAEHEDKILVIQGTNVFVFEKEDMKG